jgi:hypothetical protein
MTRLDGLVPTPNLMPADLWHDLRAVVTAAGREDQAEFAATTLKLTDTHDFPSQRLAGLHLVYLLRYAVAEAIGGRPDIAAIRGLADQHLDAFERLITHAEPDLLLQYLGDLVQAPRCARGHRRSVLRRSLRGSWRPVVGAARRPGTDEAVA